jgi:hypothetical protein
MAKTITYKVLQGIDYPPNKRAEAGDLVSDLPKEAIAWLIDAGSIVRVTGEEPVEEAVEVVVETLASDDELNEVDSGI